MPDVCLKSVKKLDTIIQEVKQVTFSELMKLLGVMDVQANGYNRLS